MLRSPDHIVTSRVNRNRWGGWLRRNPPSYVLAYASQFHHNTNRARETEVVNNGQSLGFLKRMLAFTRQRWQHI
jgi:hypothetical protein